MNQLTYVISWYQKEGDDFIGELALNDEQLEEVSRILSVRLDDLFNGVHKICPSNIKNLQKLTSQKFKPNVYEYFVEAYISS